VSLDRLGQCSSAGGADVYACSRGGYWSRVERERERERERNKSIDIDIYIYINLELFPLLEVV
jgi:hypothetical protein